LMKLDEGVSISVSIGMVALSLVGFTLIYAALIAANIYLMVKFARGSGTAVQDEASTAQTAVSLIGD